MKNELSMAIDDIHGKTTRSKYGAIRTNSNDGFFSSRGERGRWDELLMLQRAGEIFDLKRQVKFELLPSFEIDGEKIRGIDYIADFTYRDSLDGSRVVEDFKGHKTDVYKIKRKLFMHKFCPEVRFVESYK